jgi:hypothetical protein
MNNWTKVKRNDGVEKDEFIIPAAFVVTADNNVNSMDLEDITLKIFGTLKMGNSVILYFTENSRIEIMENGTIEGNGNSQQIFIGSVMKYQGNKNKTLTGPKFTDKTTRVAPTGFSTYVMLPVHFLNFESDVNKDNSVLLKWSTADEVNNNRFEMERKLKGGDWTVIGICFPNDNKSGINNYSFRDKDKLSSETCYRIKQVDNNSGFLYSAVAVVRQNCLLPEARIYSSNKTIHVEFNKDMSSATSIKVYTINGSLAASQSMDHASKKMTMNVSNLNKGIYVVQVSDNQHFQDVKKIILD